MTDPRVHWPAPERNRGPILEVLEGALPRQGLVLEIASGSGQHVAHFARALPGLTWQPSDRTDELHASIGAWAAHAGADNVRPPIVLDVTEPRWPVDRADAIFNANMIHIAPWAVCEGLMAGAGRHLVPGGPLILYGPFRVDGAHTAPSNAAFDDSLKARDPRWGVRDLEAVEREARAHGLSLEARVPMPANNQTLVFRRR